MVIQNRLTESIPKLLSIPNSTRVVLRYEDFFLLTSTSGIAYYIVSGNGAFKPDIISTGHQPKYWDRYAALYSQYVVLGSKITY